MFVALGRLSVYHLSAVGTIFIVFSYDVVLSWYQTFYLHDDERMRYVMIHDSGIKALTARCGAFSIINAMTQKFVSGIFCKKYKYI